MTRLEGIERGFSDERSEEENSNETEVSERSEETEGEASVSERESGEKAKRESNTRVRY